MLTLGQYRGLVGYLMYWTNHDPKMDIKCAMTHLGITEPVDDVISQLGKAGYEFNESTNKWEYGFDDDEC